MRLKFWGIRKTILHQLTASAGTLLLIFSFLSTSALKGQTNSNSQETQQTLAVRAAEAQHRGDYREAAQIYHQMLGDSRHDPELRANLGVMHHLLGEYGEAIRDFHTALQEQPRLFVPNLFMGLDLVQTGKAREAVSYLEAAHKLRPNDPNPVLGLGGAYKALGDLLKARKFYEEAVRLNPQNPRAWLGLGLAYSGLEEQGVDRIENDHPESPYRELLEAESLVSENRLNDALEGYRHLIQTAPVEPCFRADYAFGLLRSGRPQDAEREFGTELASAPRCLMDRLGLASIAVGRGDTTAAVRELAKVWMTDPNFFSADIPLLWQSLTPGETEGFAKAVRASYPPAFARLVLMTLDRWQKEPVETFAAGDPNFLVIPTQPVAYSIPRNADRAEAQSFYLEGKFTACRDTLNPSLPKLSAQDCLLLAECAYNSGDFRTAFLASERAVDNDGGNAAVWYWRTKASQVLAVNALVQASAAGPNSPAVHVMLGDAYFDRRMFRQAEAEYRKAIVLDPRNVAAHLGVAAALYRLFLLDKALPEVKVVLQLNPRNPQANFMMGDILAYQRRFAQAEPYAKAALHGDPSNLPLVHALLARIYAHQDLPGKAIGELKQALSVDHDGSLHYQIAILYKRIGDMSAARAALRESEALRKNHDNGTQETMKTPR